ncbi:potassium voltage-dependent transporter [Moniliophthora roreri MCA 2997]|uniref:Potassium voltage-dependent transporter n=1 Tax=Moniliophthora roreri (strain MCA 2997) TaxID=1381753 RepID=V2WN20_MONRO|nr:potassium voltage-dependent transporter [Moniliophthora roreri MCA 2997]
MPTSTQNQDTPCLSFIGIVDFSQEARWLYMTDSVTDLLGYEPHELRGKPSLELVHPDEAPRVRQLHYETIKQDKAAVLVYLRMKHKNPYKGYILCGISRTVVHNVLVGSVSFASPGAKALHNASTAQEITIISPAPELEFRRWHDPSPMPPSPIPPALRTVPATLSLRSPTLSPLPSSERSPSPTEEPPLSPTSSAASPKPAPQSSVAKLIADNSPSGINYPTPPVQSSRTALILNRFSRECTIMYCSNDHLIDPPDKDGHLGWHHRSFFDFVSDSSTEQVKQWIDTVKSWGVNERGQPSDGGFGFGRFGLVRRGKATKKEPTSPPRPGRGHRTHSTSHIARSRAHSSPLHSQRGVDREREREKHADGEGEIISVDAIFSAHSDGLMVILRRAV